MEHWTLSAMELAFGVSEPPTLDDGSGAAVAAILRAGAGLEVLLIQRAERPGDPWSGHIAFPGGRVDEGDLSPLRAAVRETAEEVGLDLDAYARPIGGLAPRPALGRGKQLGFSIHPFVFAVTGRPPPLVPEPKEVQATLWVPLAHLAASEHRGVHPYPMGEVTYRLPCCHYEGHTIWGLTLRMLDDLLDVARTIPRPG